MEPPASILGDRGAGDQDPPLAVHYVDHRLAGALISKSRAILGVIGFGVACADFLPAGCPFIAAPMSCPASGAMVEIWSASQPCRSLRVGPVAGTETDDLVFGAVTLDEPANASLQGAVESAYLGIFDFLDAAGGAAPIRFWNYLTGITRDDHGLDRYRRFNIGRQLGFSARLAQPLPPAASCVGGDHGASIIYFLGARKPARHVENPRQVSAFRYPPIYGPQSPSFSRASIHTTGSGAAVFISGTASISGHESRHRGDLQGQIAETIENLRAIIGTTGRTDGEWAFKIYLEDPANYQTVQQAIGTAFGPAAKTLLLRADMCRSELMLEIEAFGLCGSANLPSGRA